MTTAGQVTDSPLGSAAPTTLERPELAAVVAATISVGVGAVHLALVPEHLEHWWVFGSFFAAVGLFQLIYAAAVLWRPTWQVALLGIVANLGIVLTYVMSRTVGLPITPPEHEEEAGGHGEFDETGGGFTEAVGAVDMATAAAELVLIGVLVSLLPQRLRSSTCNVLLLIGVTLWGLRVAGALG